MCIQTTYLREGLIQLSLHWSIRADRGSFLQGPTSAALDKLRPSLLLGEADHSDLLSAMLPKPCLCTCGVYHGYLHDVEMKWLSRVLTWD